MQLLLSIFIGWIILLSRVPADYSCPGSGSSPTDQYIYFQQHRHLNEQGARRRTKGDPHQMKPATIIGALLILLSIIGFATGGISFTHQKKDVDLGPVQVSHETKDTLPISPILSTLALVAGVGLVAVGVKGR
jgi:hypothetical protein